MTFRDRLALAFPPLLLRLVLAVTFVWAGWGKIFSTIDFNPEQSAALANMGLTFHQAQPGAPIPPAGPLPDPTDDSPPEAATEDDSVAFADLRPSFELTLVQGRSLAERSQDDPADDAAPDEPESDSPPAAAPQPPPAAPSAFTAEDFPAGVQARRVLALALLMHARANPPDGQPALFPASLAQAKRPVYLAWAVAVVELVGGFFVLLGFLTRLAALGLAASMVGAIWLTTLGPSAMGAAPAFLGFLPAIQNYEPAAWSEWLWQLALLAMALCLVLGRPGVLSMDTMLFSRKRRAEHTSDDD